MAEPQKTPQNTSKKLHPRTINRLKREAAGKWLAKGRNARRQGTVPTESLPLSLDESEQGVHNSNSSSSDTDVDMDESGITMFSTPSKEEMDLALSPEKGKCK